MHLRIACRITVGIVMLLSLLVGCAVYEASATAGWSVIACLVTGFMSATLAMNLLTVLIGLNFAIAVWSVLQLAEMFDPAAGEAVRNWIANQIERCAGPA